MKTRSIFPALAVISCISTGLYAQSQDQPKKPALFMDVHQLEPGKVTLQDVAKEHEKDLAIQDKAGVRFLRYWVDEENGLIYCLSSAPDPEAVRKTHKDAHGMEPQNIYAVTEGTEVAPEGTKELFMDIHEIGPGKVTASDVEAAHQKDLAVENKHGVKFLNYWVNEKDGVIMCLSEASNAEAVVQTHKEAHGMAPASIHRVKQGQ
ncbi:MAG TPA: DUF4242 domain-containing protein [Sphingobacteriaceae bacterium]